MYLCKVNGKCVSTIKHPGLKGYSLVSVQKLGINGEPSGDLLIAVDPIGCSVGETVLVTFGSNARFALTACETPVDAVIVGIADSCQ